jgi:hypothetical protein
MFFIDALLLVLVPALVTLALVIDLAVLAAWLINTALKQM